MDTQDGQRSSAFQVRLDGMHAEEQRLRTFRGWPVAVIDSARIAKAGFFRTGRGAEVECFACGGRITEWNYGDVAMARHRELNPNCPFVKNPTASSNIPIAVPSSSSLQEERKEKLNETVDVHNQVETDYKREEVRLASFTEREGKIWPKQEEVTPSALAKAGFYWNPSSLYSAEVSDRVTCAFCESSLGGWEIGDDPMSEHRRCSSTCPFIMGAPVGNVPILRSVDSAVEGKQSHPRCAHGIGGSQFGNEKLVELVSNSKQSGISGNQKAETLGVHPHSGPINVRYSTLESRVASYCDKWRKRFSADTAKMSPLLFAEAGFFYTGLSDQVRCFHCDLGLWEWQEDDDPWIEHARWLSNCEYVRLVKGEEFIVAAKNLVRRNDSIKNTSVCSNSLNCSAAVIPEESPESLLPVSLLNQCAQQRKVRIVTIEELDHLMKSAPVLMALEVGLDAGRVRNILLRKIEESGVPFTSPDALVLEVLNSQSQEGRDEESDDSGEERFNREIENTIEGRQVDSVTVENSVNELAFEELVLYNQLTDSNNVPVETENDQSRNRISCVPRKDSSICAPKKTVNMENGGSSKTVKEVKRTSVRGNKYNTSDCASSIAALEEENRRYRESHLCKVCLDNEVGVVFLPCGHLVSCVNCAPSLKDCPVCRRSIGACVRTYLS